MVQVPGPNGGITSIDQHEVSTWSPAVAGTAIVVKPVATDHPSILTFIKAIRDRRKEN